MIGNSTEISITEEDEESIHIVAINKPSRTAASISIGFLALTTVVAYRGGWSWAAVSVGVALLFAMSGFTSSTTVFVATKETLRANQTSTFEADKNLHLPWTTIYRLDYDGGGEDGPTGLYAFTGRFQSVCLIRDITLEQSTKITNAIFRKFPMVVMADPPTPLTTLVSDTFKELTKGWRAKDDSASR